MHCPHHFKPQEYVWLTLFFCLGGGEPTTATIGPLGEIECSPNLSEDDKETHHLFL